MGLRADVANVLVSIFGVCVFNMHMAQLVEKKEDLSAMINSTFRGVFVHRYRDKLADIRVSCISELGVWMKINPEKFLDDSYLKYLGWTLYDKVASSLDQTDQCVNAVFLVCLLQVQKHFPFLMSYYETMAGKIGPVSHAGL